MRIIGDNEVTLAELASMAGVARASAAHVVDQLTLHYTLYQVRRGVYKLARYGDYEKYEEERKHEIQGDTD